ncbi:hypothetical protein K457DRAFT_242018 [Linnemannia elongata AG-77]|uniref:Uncharacterized protein n=1 Tax=Linnemannia elongata AG-77 TaxID=1314771 RepID=A0A197JDF4_9FUNG|nr:hypothetical protein K457DRAFT_242018 [Linnemannia elongata AG-77]
MRFRRVGSGGGNVIVGLVISPMGVLVEMVGVVRRGIMVMDRRTTGFGAYWYRRAVVGSAAKLQPPVAPIAVCNPSFPPSPTPLPFLSFPIFISA